MDHFAYRNGTLHCEGVPLVRIAEQIGTPVYVYSSATLVHHFQIFKDAVAGVNALVCYAVKANSNQAVLRTLAAHGAGADVVSKGELLRALKAGIPASKIVFSGVGKTADEITAGLEAGILQFNVESEAELHSLSKTASKRGLTAPVALRLNPDVDARTHAKISTGKSENKFGVPWREAERLYALAAELPGIAPVGVDMHIGSQLSDLSPFREAYAKLASLVTTLRDQGHRIERIDLGGGLGIPYAAESASPPPPEAYGAMVREVFAGIEAQFIFEPGRLIAGNAGVLLARVIYEKEGTERRFYILDAAMNDLARPALYDAHHDIVPLIEQNTDDEVTADFVGPICESGDIFARDRTVARYQSGDMVAFRSVGAYGAVMASNYNSRPFAAEVLVRGEDFHVIRARQDIDALIALDSIPPWLD